MRLLITGGTGALGRELVAAATAQRMAVRTTSRRRPPSEAQHTEWMPTDLATGRGVAEALKDVETIIHTASDFTRSQLIDVDGTARLLEAARAAGVAHLIFVSIVGIDCIPYRYYRHKLTAERMIAAGSVPHTTLRATQFHSLIDEGLRAASRVPLFMPLPSRFRVQGIAPRDVADRLIQAVTDGPRQRVPDLGGPEILTLEDVTRSWMAAAGVTKPIVSLFIPGRMASAFRAGKNTVATGARGTTTWQEWLTHRYAPPHR